MLRRQGRNRRGINAAAEQCSAFAQRRSEQNVADLSAMAGAYAYLNTTGTVSGRAAAADAAARVIASARPFHAWIHSAEGVAKAV